jgi:hypothetical protein
MQSSNGGSAGLSDIWQAAVARYEARTGVRLRLMSSAQGVDGVLSHIQGNKEMFKKKRHNGSHLQEWRSWLKSSFESIDALGKIVAHATKGVFPPSEAIFGAVQYLLSVANTVSANFDRISKLFDDMSTYLQRLQILRHTVPPSPELHEVVIAILGSVLDLCGHTTKYMKMKRISKSRSVAAFTDRSF